MNVSTNRSILTVTGEDGPSNLASSTTDALPSPIQCLPHEMLSKIFILSIPAHDNFQKVWRYRTNEFKRAIMLPMNVCRYWRNIALSTPGLWSSICLRLLESTVDADVNLTQTWLSRSGQLPISIQIDGRRYGSHDPHAIHPVLDVIIEHAERWQHVDFDMSYAMLSHTRTAKNRLPHLHTLIISDLYFEPEWAMPITIFEAAPRLSRLTMRFNVSFHSLEVPWTRITTLACKGPTLDEFHEVLQGAPNIVECNLYIGRSDRELDPARPMIQHEHLCIFNIVAYNESGSLLDRLSLPALQSFEYDNDTGRWPQREFISLISRSGCSVEKLVLRSQRLWLDDDLIECIRYMPSLVHLELDPLSSAAITDKTLSRLTIPTSIPRDAQVSYLVPKLEFIRLSPRNQFCGGALVGMVESRRCFSNTSRNNDIRHVYYSPLKTLQLHIDESSGGLSSSTLARLRNCGLDIYGVQFDDDGELCCVPF